MIDRKKYQDEVDRTQEVVRQKHLWNVVAAHIAKPIKAGQPVDSRPSSVFNQIWLYSSSMRFDDYDEPEFR